MKKRNKLLKIILILFILGLTIFYNKEHIMKFLYIVYSSFKRTVIDENRYILFLNGLESTLLISFLSIMIGTLLGFILFLFLFR